MASSTARAAPYSSTLSPETLSVAAGLLDTAPGNTYLAGDAGFASSDIRCRIRFGDGYYEGRIRRLRYWNTRKPDGFLQEWGFVTEKSNIHVLSDSFTE